MWFKTSVQSAPIHVSPHSPHLTPLSIQQIPFTTARSVILACWILSLYFKADDFLRFAIRSTFWLIYRSHWRLLSRGTGTAPADQASAGPIIWPISDIIPLDLLISFKFGNSYRLHFWLAYLIVRWLVATGCVPVSLKNSCDANNCKENWTMPFVLRTDIEPVGHFQAARMPCSASACEVSPHHLSTTGNSVGLSARSRGYSAETETTHILSDLLDAVDRAETAVTVPCLF